jgi:hypothetical protein
MKAKPDCWKRVAKKAGSKMDDGWGCIPLERPQILITGAELEFLRIESHTIVNKTELY